MNLDRSITFSTNGGGVRGLDVGRLRKVSPPRWLRCSFAIFPRNGGEAVKKISHFVEKSFFRKSKKNLSIFPACGIFPLSPRATPSYGNHHHHHPKGRDCQQSRSSDQRFNYHREHRGGNGCKPRWTRLQLHACAGNRR